MRIPKLKLRTLLLSVFLFTIVTSSLAIISFTYTKYSKSIDAFSKGTIERAGNALIARVDCLLHDFEKLPMLDIDMIARHPEMSLENQELILFFFSQLKHNPLLVACYAGTPAGSYMTALDFTVLNIQAGSGVPPNTAYAIFVPDEPGSAKDAYYDKNFDRITTNIVPEQYDPRVRPWYTGAEQTKGLFWTRIYQYAYPSNSLGISVSMPVYDSSGKLLSVAGVSLSSDVFSGFLAEQKISKNGQAFVLDENGRILFPEYLKNGASAELTDAAFRSFQQKKKSNFHFTFSGETYLSSMHPFPPSFNNKWTIAVIAPRSDFFSAILAAQRLAVFFSLGVIVLASLLVIFLSQHLSKPIVALSDEIDRIAQLELDSERRVSSQVSEISRIDASIASMRMALRSFAHYVPSEIAKQLMLKEHEIVLGGDKKTITIFFTDIADFTAISESLPIETVNTLLADHFDALSQIILQCEGLIDKYMGDGIMSLWGAPEETPDQAANACKAALLCQVRLSELNAKQRQVGMPEFVTRMGIVTGQVIVGNFGTAKRMNYSAIGDPVNTAFRLQTLNKIYGTKILIGQVTRMSIGNRFLVRPLGAVEVRGKKEKLNIFELVGSFEGDSSLAPTSEQIELCTAFTEAYNAFEQGNFDEAKRLFSAIHDRFPDDLPAKLFLDRLA